MPTAWHTPTAQTCTSTTRISIIGASPSISSKFPPRNPGGRGVREGLSTLLHPVRYSRERIAMRRCPRSFRRRCYCWYGISKITWERPQLRSLMARWRATRNHFPDSKIHTRSRAESFFPVKHEGSKLQYRGTGVRTCSKSNFQNGSPPVLLHHQFPGQHKNSIQFPECNF